MRAIFLWASNPAGRQVAIHLLNRMGQSCGVLSRVTSCGSFAAAADEGTVLVLVLEQPWLGRLPLFDQSTHYPKEQPGWCHSDRYPKKNTIGRSSIGPRRPCRLRVKDASGGRNCRDQQVADNHRWPQPSKEWRHAHDDAAKRIRHACERSSYVDNSVEFNQCSRCRPPE